MSNMQTKEFVATGIVGDAFIHDLHNLYDKTHDINSKSSTECKYNLLHRLRIEVWELTGLTPIFNNVHHMLKPRVGT